MDEHEQGELVRQWLRDNGTSILGGIAVSLTLALGWQWMQHGKAQHRVDASSTYQALEEAIERKDNSGIDQLAAELADKFSDTPYGALALMQLAEQKLAQGDIEAAQSALSDAASVSQSKAIEGLANLRLARVQLADGKAQDALDSLAKLPDGDYTGLAAEVRGDALMALGRADEAEAAYQDALTSLETGAPNRSIVEMKLADLGVVPSEPGA